MFDVSNVNVEYRKRNRDRFGNDLREATPAEQNYPLLSNPNYSSVKSQKRQDADGDIDSASHSEILNSQIKKNISDKKLTVPNKRTTIGKKMSVARVGSLISSISWALIICFLVQVIGGVIQLQGVAFEAYAEGIGITELLTLFGLLDDTAYSRFLTDDVGTDEVSFALLVLGLTMFQTGYFISVFGCIVAIILISLVCLISGIKIFGNHVQISLFIMTVALAFLPFLNIFPFIVFWIVSIAYSSFKNTSPSE